MNWRDKIKKLLNLKEGEAKMILTKKCNKCGVAKPVTEFHKSESKRLGVQGTCKECRSSLNKKQKEGEKMFEMKIVETKMCFKCKEVKPITEFYKCSSNADGLYSYCRVCQRADQQEHYALKGNTPSVEDLETFVCNEKSLITLEEKRMEGRGKKIAARIIILTKKENKLLKLKEAAAKQAETVKPEPILLEQDNIVESVEVVWESVGKLDPIEEVRQEVLNAYKKHSGTNDYGVVSNCRCSDDELKKIHQEFVDTGVLEQRWCKEQGRWGYRYKTPNIFLKEDKGQLFA